MPEAIIHESSKLMNREIKFRVWDGKKMWFLSYEDLLGAARELSPRSKYDWPGFADTVMQYTGMIDKNDAEIYEGDILRYFDDNVTVEWFDGAWVIGRGYDEYLSDHLPEEHMEVIGNIYENPEAA